MEKFQKIIQEQIKFTDNLPEDDYYVINEWKLVPLKLIPELTTEIVHQYTDRNMEKGKYNKFGGEEELSEGFIEYMEVSDLGWTNSNGDKRGKWIIEFFDFDGNGIYMKTKTCSEDIFVDAWCEFLQND